MAWAIATDMDTKAANMAAAAHPAMEDMGSLASTETLSQEPTSEAVTGLSQSDYSNYTKQITQDQVLVSKLLRIFIIS